MDFKDAYVAVASDLEKAYGLDRMTMAAEPLLEHETFPFIENLLLKAAAKSVLGKEYDGALSMAEKRIGLFWSRESPETQLGWKLIETATGLMRQAGQDRRGP